MHIDTLGMMQHMVSFVYDEVWMFLAPTHEALLTSLHTFIVCFFSSTLPVTKTNRIVFLHWQKCCCEKMYLEANWVGRNNDWLLDGDVGKINRKKALNLSLVHSGALLCSLSYKTFCLSLSGNEWTHCPGQFVGLLSAQMEIQLFAFVTWLVHCYDFDIRML